MSEVRIVKPVDAVYLPLREYTDNYRRRPSGVDYGAWPEQYNGLPVLGALVVEANIPVGVDVQMRRRGLRPHDYSYSRKRQPNGRYIYTIRKLTPAVMEPLKGQRKGGDNANA